MPIINVQNLQKAYYGDEVATTALHGVSFSINPGEFVAFMGPSGSGKSTLLHILGFLDKATNGSYLFENINSENFSEDEIAKIRNKKMGFIFQAFNLLARTSVLENVKLPLLYSDVPKKHHEQMARDAIGQVGLNHRMAHHPSQLSGGEKQRVAIARALVNNPSVIFADEPTGNLDSKSGQTVMEILQKLNQERDHTIILITHETYTAQHARRIIHILDGRIERDERIENSRAAQVHFQK